jgi:hypothetical protein
MLSKKSCSISKELQYVSKRSQKDPHEKRDRLNPDAANTSWILCSVDDPWIGTANDEKDLLPVAY